MRRTRLDHKSCGKGHNQLFILVFDLNTRLNRAEICGIYGRRFLDEIDLCLQLIILENRKTAILVVEFRHCPEIGYCLVPLCRSAIAS